MAKYIIIALHEEEDAKQIASDISEMLGYAGVVREVLNLDSPSDLLERVRSAFVPDFEKGV